MRIYLDHAASTPMRPEALAAMQSYCTDPELMANPSSRHADGWRAAEALNQCREAVAAHFACAPSEVVFNSGGSEGDNHAVRGAAKLLKRRHNRKLHLAISAIEHEAVAESAKEIETHGHRVTRLPVSSEGVLPLETLDQLCREDRPDFVSLMSVNNEIGTVQPVGEAALLCQHHGVLFHTDAVRAVGHGLRVIQHAAHIPLLNCTGHKFGGPRGVGVLVQRFAGIRQATDGQFDHLPPFIVGGGQEYGQRAGTENLAGIAGLAAALDLCTDGEAARLEHLRARLERSLREHFADCVIHGSGAARATHITSVAFPGHDSQRIHAALNERGVSVGVGSACHSGSGSAGSKTLAAMGVAPELGAATLRISLGWNTQDEHIDALLLSLGEIVV